MRSDMAQLLVEHPRHHAGELYRVHRRKANRDPEEAPAKQGMRRPYVERKEFGEYFAPITGFLRKNVGRPWDTVFSELSGSLTGGGAIVDHVRLHVLRDFVILQPAWHDGIACYPAHTPGLGRTQVLPIQQRFNDGFYVDQQGFLRRAPAARRWKHLRRPKPFAIKIDERSSYYKLDQVWYRVWLKPLPAPEFGATPLYDVVLRSWVRCKFYPADRFRGATHSWAVDGDQRADTSRLEATHGFQLVAYQREQISSRVIRRERLNDRLAELG